MSRQKSDPTSIFDDLYQPQFLPKNLRIREFVNVTSVQEKQKSIRSVNNKRALSELLSSKPKLPLTPEEAEIVDKKIEQLLNHIERIRSKILDSETQIDSLLSHGEKEVSYTLRIDKKPRLKKAVKVLFGKKTDVITYTMYKEALAIKKKLEDEQIPDLFTKED
jgi:hypothetical protein